VYDACVYFIVACRKRKRKRKRSYVLCIHRTISTDDVDMDGDDSDGDGVDHGSVSISQRATVDAHQYPIELMCSFCVYLYCTVL
jgi:hypothetical protein